MRNRQMRATALCLALALLVSCSHNIYKRGDKTFGSEAEALAAQKADFDRMLGLIEPAQPRIGGALLFCTPRFETVYDFTLAEQPSPPPVEAKTFFAKTTFADNRYTYDAIVRRNAFDRVDRRWTNGERCDPTEEHVGALSLYMPIGWFFTSKSVAREQVPYDPNEKDPVKRGTAFLIKLEALARIK